MGIKHLIQENPSLDLNLVRLISKLDPSKTNKEFNATILLDELNINKVNEQPDNDGYLSTTLPRTGSKVRLKFLTMRDTIEVYNWYNTLYLNIQSSR